MSSEMIIITVLVLTSGALLAVYIRAIWQLDKVKKEQDIIEARTRQKAVKMVEEAKDKALAIIANTKIDAKESQEEIDKKLTEITNHQVEYYKQMLQNITNDIKSDTLKMLEQQSEGAQNTVIQKIEDDYTLAKKQIEDYKSEKIKQIDTHAVELLKDFTKLALGRVWTKQEHEELIEEALAEAKKHYVI